MHPLDGTFLKLCRADEHLQGANDLMQEFLKRKPYRINDTFVRNGNTKERVLRFEQLEYIPTKLPMLIGDACNNLRSALDHLLWQLWILQYPTFDESVYFPICDSESAFKKGSPENIGPRRAKSVGTDKISLTDNQRAIIESLQPYKTRNPALSFLRDVNNSDKHRLIQVISLIGDVKKLRLTADTTSTLLEVPLPHQIHIQRIHNTKIENGAILARIPLNSFSRGTQLRVQSYATINFAFQGCRTAHRQIIYESIKAMLSEASRAVSLFEPEFASFGTSEYTMHPFSPPLQ
jgi:hypothetical protein